MNFKLIGNYDLLFKLIPKKKFKIGKKMILNNG